MFQPRIGDYVRATATGRTGWVVGFKTPDEQEEHWERNRPDPDASCPVFEHVAVVEGEAESGTFNVNPEELENLSPTLYVNVYLHDRKFGGREEGGWWFDQWKPILSLRCRDEAHAKEVFEARKKWVEEENKGRRDISSVLSEGVYEVKLEPWEGQLIPEMTPQYS